MASLFYVCLFALIISAEPKKNLRPTVLNVLLRIEKVLIGLDSEIAALSASTVASNSLLMSVKNYQKNIERNTNKQYSLTQNWNSVINHVDRFVKLDGKHDIVKAGAPGTAMKGELKGRGWLTCPAFKGSTQLCKYVFPHARYDVNRAGEASRFTPDFWGKKY